MTNKFDKKLDTKIIKVLTRACEQAKQKVDGFVWLTHRVDYRQFPSSLMITCVFDSKDHQLNATHTQSFEYMQELITEQLARINVIVSPQKQISADNEQACLLEHNGDWERRLATH